MMPYLSDRQRIELALPATLMAEAIKNIVAGNRTNDNETVLNWLLDAKGEPFIGIDGIKYYELSRRLESVEDAILSEFDGHSAGKIALAAAYFAKELTDTDKLMLNAESAFDKAYTAIISGLDDHADVMSGMDKSAQKGGKRMLQIAKSMGYYR